MSIYFWKVLKSFRYAWLRSSNTQELPLEELLAQYNGIAYDAATDRIFVTGKWWSKLFEIKLTQ